MTRITFLTIALVLAWFPGAQARATGIDAATAARYFDEALTASDRDAGRLWGVRLYGPMLFVDAATRRVVANRADAGGRLAADGPVFAGRLPDDMPIANTSVDWSGVRWAMILWPLPEDATHRTALMEHELFHRAQPEIGLPLSNPANAHLDTLEGRYLMRLEWRALRTALLSRGAARARAVADAMVFRARRHARFGPAADEERALELNEGLAEYTGCALATNDPSARRAHAVALLDAAEAKPSFTRSFAYGSGPAYGVLLDERGARWRAGLGARTDLGELLASAFALRPPADLAREADRRAARYGGAELLATETERERARAAREAAHRARLVDGPVLVIPLKSPSVSFDPNALEPLAGLGTVYTTMQLSDAWGTLSVTGGALLSPDWSAVTVPADGAGWTLDLASGWRIVPGARSTDRTLAGP